VAVVVDDRHFPSAWGMTKKTAEQGAAKLALIEMELLDQGDLADDESA
jgi:dsRNA-specific ribonuclease